VVSSPHGFWHFYAFFICLTLLDSITLIKFKTRYCYPSCTDIREAALLCYLTSLRELFDTDKSLLCISIFYLKKEIEKAAAQISMAIQPQHLTISMLTHRAEWKLWYILAQIGNLHNPEGSNNPEYAAQNDALCSVPKGPSEDRKAEKCEAWNRERTRIRKNL